MKPGRYLGITNDDYHSSVGLSKTQLDLFARDQQALQWARDCPVDADKLKTLDFGDAMHAIALEPDRLRDDFAVMPAFNLRTNTGKACRDDWLRDNGDKRVLKSEEHKKLQLMFESVMAHPTARDLLERPGVAEASHYWIDPDTELLCRCRPDRDITGTDILLDIKTTEDIKKFPASVDDYRYYVQEAFYMDGYNETMPEQKDRMIFLVIQKKIELGRYPVVCCLLPCYAVQQGRYEYLTNLVAYQHAAETGEFTGISDLKMPYQFDKRIGHV